MKKYNSWMDNELKDGQYINGINVGQKLCQENDKNERIKEINNKNQIIIHRKKINKIKLMNPIYESIMVWREKKGKQRLKEITPGINEWLHDEVTFFM